MEFLKKHSARIIIAFLIGLAFLFLWSRFVDFRKIKSHLLHINVALAATGLFFYFLSFYVRSYRMRAILEPVVKLNQSTSFNILMAGNMINILVPIRLGELSKCYFIKKLKKVRMSKTLPSIFIDKIMDLTPVLLLLFLLPFLSMSLPGELSLVIMAVLLIFAIAVFVLFLSLRYDKFVIRIILKMFFWFPKRFKKRFTEIVTLFVRGMSVIKQSPGNLFKILFMTFITVVSDSAYLMLTYAAFGYKIPFIFAMFGFTLFNLSFILPTPPAQIGSSELVQMLIFSSLFGVERNLASAVALFIHATVASVAIVIGIISLYLLRIRSDEVFKLV
ncbi:flippase-like domain-containing protein [Candidatus Woesearchaeota archaeon]|nr:flippase-like domain-containing protein [Candidatus Woesearchaeota archaeon]